MDRSRLFDQVAAAYERVRPGYPEALADDVIAFAGLGAGARLLEVGAGTGQATALFGGRGFAVDALEPGANLARIAREKLRDARVRVLESRFEEHELDPTNPYDLVYGAQSFHWVEPAVRYVKSAQALREGGTLALFWHAPQPGTGTLHAAVQEAYRRHVPDLAVRPPDGRWAAEVADEIDASGAFGSVHAIRYPWSRWYSAEDYAELLGTQSDHLQVGAEQRGRLLGEVRAMIAQHGGTIEIGYVLRLYLARRLTGPRAPAAPPPGGAPR